VPYAEVLSMLVDIMHMFGCVGVLNVARVSTHVCVLQS
jgi:hypothetical protein